MKARFTPARPAAQPFKKTCAYKLPNRYNSLNFCKRFVFLVSIMTLNGLLNSGRVFAGNSPASRAENNPAKNNPAENNKPGLSNNGIITGNVLEDNTGKPVPDATVALICLTDPAKGQFTMTKANGDFTFNNLDYGIYQLKISAVGFSPLAIDSIRLRVERSDFNLNDLKLSPKNAELEQVVVYAEKPLVQSKGGNITFNVAESALSASSNANELLRNVPLVTKDPNGNLLVRGKQPKVLIDDKPVDLNAQQLQDFLDGLPGNLVEKIEVMTNPPPQYANEEGGVINIITRKGKIGIGGRLSIYGGTRGEAGVNTNLNYRDKRLAINFSAGEGYNLYKGDGYSNRQNIYPDSTNYFNSAYSYKNRNTRPNGRLSVDYDLDKNNSLNAVLQYNQNDFRNRSVNDYTQLDRHQVIGQLSTRSLLSTGQNLNPNVSFTFKHRGSLPGEQLQVIGSYNYSRNRNERNFYQQFLNPDHTPNGLDSTQIQENNSRNTGFNMRVNYDRPVFGGKTFLSVGAFYNYSNNPVDLTTRFLQKPDSIFVIDPRLSNDLRFVQTITNFRGSVRQTLAEGLNLLVGTSLAQTSVKFNLYAANKNTSNTYWNWLPFANLSKTWQNQWSATLIYRRTVRRPGIDELNPSIDYSDPYNIRFGNPDLQASLSHNFEMNIGKSNNKYYLNYSLGFNKVQDIFSQIQTLLPNGTTQTTFENISNRSEYSTSTWSGYTFSRAFRINMGASYSYNQYSLFDRVTNNYHDGGSLYSNFNLNYSPGRLWNLNGGMVYNRYANPQGTVSSSVNMNMSIQRKFFDKKFIVNLAITDPFIQQNNTSRTQGTQFNLESYSSTRTRNFRLTLSYDLNRTIDAGKNKLLKAAHRK
ncbi:TonB-dependent receptor domain-containing protein [Flavitalea flava]